MIPVLAFALASVVAVFAYGLSQFLPKARQLVTDLENTTNAARGSDAGLGDRSPDAVADASAELGIVWRRVKAARFTAANGRVVLAHEPADLLTADDLLDATKGFRLWSAIPNYLVGLGLLFTFIGLVLALQGIDAANLRVTLPDSRGCLPR